jgi:recombinational DNA repair protein (RecF pathway)
MDNQEFLSKTHCDRCGTKLGAFTLSWFTEEVICSDCMDKEGGLRAVLRDKGFSKAMEGCGYIPNVEEIQSISDEVVEHVKLMIEHGRSHAEIDIYLLNENRCTQDEREMITEYLYQEGDL